MKSFLYTMVIVCTVLCFRRAAPCAPSIGEWRTLETTDTLDVFYKDRIVGTLIHATRPVDSVEGVIVSTSMAIRKQETGVSQMELLERRVYNIDGDLRSARQVMKSPSGANTWTLYKTPQGWRLSVDAGGETSASIIADFRESLLPTLAIIKKVRRMLVKVGETWSDTQLELVSGKTVATVYRCAAIDTARKNVSFDMVDDITGRHELWQVDASGKTLVQEVEGIFVARKSAPAGRKERRRGIFDMAELADLLSAPASRPAGDSERIAVALPPALAIDASVADLYVHKGDRWLLGNAAAGCSCSSNVSPPDSAMLQWTLPTATLQSTYPSIVQLSKKIRGDEKSPCAVIRLLTMYVFSSLEKRNSATFSNALETLKAGFGDCGEHAVLLAALLRSSGIPAHVVLGLIYLEPKKAYVGHAWVMVWSGKWIFADPAFGVFPACSDRVPLLIDDNGRNAVLLAKLMGRIKIEYAAER